jgi:GATA-binding protein
LSELDQESAAANGASASGGEMLSVGGSGAGRVRRGSTGIGEAGEDAEDDLDPETMAKKDPLATQVWRMYAKQKSQLSNGARMENITWRMMALTLRKKKEQERAQAAAEAEALARQTAAAGAGDSYAGSSSVPTGVLTTATQSTSTSPDLTHSAASHPSSRRSSGSQGESAGVHAPLSAMKGSTALYGMTALDEGPTGSGRAKGRARFAEAFHEEEERGRRGRNSKTPDSGHG